MEEKQFKCSECDAKFTTLELLQNHSRRHEMSINLPSRSILSLATSQSTPASSGMNKGSLSAGVLGFVDETPTPTRFIRNCEEVGLFQDLQNVNPFDEDFKKAASSTATPSGEATGFEFSFSSSVIGTPSTECGQNIIRTSRSKRRYSEQDTLNTPQVFPYFASTGGCNTLTTNTASMSACLTPTPQNSLTNDNENLSSGLHQTPPPETSSNSLSVSTTSYNHEEHVSIIAHTSAISQQTNNNKSDGASTVKVLETTKSVDLLSKKTSAGNHQRRVSSLKVRSKANLKLDLKTLESKNKFLSEKVTSVHRNLSPEDLPASEPDFSNKTELLERNRAAAHRSRERRKQWIYGLESRCRALETLLAQSQTEVCRLRTENEALKVQLQNQSRDDVRVEPENVTIHSVATESIVVHQTSHKKVQTAIQEPLADNGDASSDIVIVSPIILPTVKAKRGRPRKGEERRVPILAVPMLSTEEKSKSLPKIPILPISQSNKKS